MRFLCFALTVLAACETSPPGAAPAAPAAAPVRTAEEGRADADAHIARGLLQIIAFGELPPPDSLDPASGLPLGTEGCEIDPSHQAYMDAYNARMRDYAAQNPPFPDDLVVTYVRRGGMHTDKVEITRAGVRRYFTQELHARGKMRMHGSWRPVQSLTAQRLRVGVLAQRVASTPIPEGKPPRRRGRVLRIARGGQDWTVSWKPGERPPEVAPVLEAIHELP